MQNNSLPPDSVGYGGQLGNYTDVETNLILMGFRYYSPFYCRFLTRDPSGYEGGINLYAYCRNNPINRADPTGLQQHLLHDAAETTTYVLRQGDSAFTNNPVLAQTAVTSTLFASTATYNFLGGASFFGPVGVAAVAIPAASYLGYNFIGVPLANHFYGPQTLDTSVDNAYSSLYQKLRNCFVAGTLIAMADGTFQPIEAIKTGERVLSRDPLSGQTSAKAILQTFAREVEQTLVLRFDDGEQIETTPGHPFYVAGKGFVLAGQLALGNAIVTRAGPAAILTGLQNKTERVRVYNVEVADFHTYFVGSHHGGLWVHNDSWRIHGVNPDWAVKGAHITYSGFELAVRPGAGGNIVFKPFFSGGGQAATTAAANAQELLQNKDFLTRLLDKVKGAKPYVLQYPNEGGVGRSAELHFLEEALQRLLGQ